MCGIAGKLDFGSPVDEGVVQAMCRAMEHRGPDARGVHIEEGVGLGVQRLAIIDVAGGAQPIRNEDGSLAVALNGEIYNYRELREELLARGHRFSTHADTEVLVHLYEDDGDALVRRLRGMFAFAIWDRRRRRLLCARDRVGKKPLFWSRRGARFWFASEVRALLADPELPRDVDPQAIGDYLTYGCVPHPRSVFRGIRKLPPASTMVVTEEGVEIERYWSLDYEPKLKGVPQHELEERLLAELREATRIRLMSEVPLGAFLSGGIDSSAVVAAMAEESASPVKTFSIGFPDDDFDELRYARLVARRFSTDHHEFEVEPEAVSMVPRLARHYGEPFADPSAIPSFILAEVTGRHVTVALNGDGGDESFAGYDEFLLDQGVERYARALPGSVRRWSRRLGQALGDGAHHQALRSRIGRRAEILGMPRAERFARWLSAFDARWRKRLLAPEFLAALEDASDPVVAAWHGSVAADPVDRMLDVEIRTYLPDDLLVKMDIATMAHSVEARSPFLDQKLMAFAAALPPEAKLKRRTTKRLLRSALRGHIPDEILGRPKMGFAVPLARWFREELRDLPREVLLDPATLARGYFEPTEVERIVREHSCGKADHSLRIWTLLQLEVWHREVLESPARAGAPVV